MRHTSTGFTVVETLIALAIGSIVISALYQVFHDQQKSFVTQDQVVEMQQNGRAGIYFMTKELRSASFDPEDSELFGFVTDFEAPNDIFAVDIDYANDRTRVAFTMDDNEDGTINNLENELIAYQFNPSNFTITRYQYTATGDRWDIIATNIEALDFVFLDVNGNVTTDPSEFHAVEVSIVARTKNYDNEYDRTITYLNKQGDDICPTCSTNTHLRRRLLSTTIRLRNS